jgi:hypothetical protein
MFDIFGSPDHFTETGVDTSIAAPIKVAPIKNIFRIVVLLNKDTRLILNHSASIGTLIRINFACEKTPKQSNALGIVAILCGTDADFLQFTAQTLPARLET